MKKRTLLYSFIFTLALASCAPAIPEEYFKKTDDDSGGEEPLNPGVVVSEINGTEIYSSSTAVGWVYDAETNRGIPGVPVSDGYDFTLTDENGVYQMAANRYTRRIFITVPAEYEIPLDPNTHYPVFYSPKGFNRKVMNRYDFSLKKLPSGVENDWTLVAIGDPQCKNEADYNRFKSETIPHIQQNMQNHQAKGERMNAYAMTLGDIQQDSPEMWPSMYESMSNVEIGNGKYLSFFQTIGNHDHTKYTTAYDSVSDFMDYFGPVDYSFDRGMVHVISMDDVLVSATKATWSYGAGLTDMQWKWLKKDISLVKDKENKIVLFCSHISFRTGGSGNGGDDVGRNNHYEDILELLSSNFKEAHLIIGHKHYPQNYIHSQYICKSGLPVYEHILACACGAWWTSRLSANGSPSGWTCFEFSGNTVKNWVAEGTGMDSNAAQMRVYCGNDIYGSVQGDYDYRFSWTGGGYMDLSSEDAKKNSRRPGYESFADCFVAAIWGGDELYWKVDFEYGGKTYPMTKLPPGTSIADMCVSAYNRTMLNQKTVTSYSKDHSTFWYVKVDGVDPASATGWTVRARQTIPGSGTTNEYTCSTMQRDFSGFDKP